jgi:hypothetical protein
MPIRGNPPKDAFALRARKSEKGDIRYSGQKI